MDHLAAARPDLPAAGPQPARRALGRLAGRPAAIVTFLDGISVRRPNARHCHALGGALARLHEAGQRFRYGAAERALARRAGRPLFAAAEAEADTVAPGLAARTRRELSHLATAWPVGPARAASSTPISSPTTCSSCDETVSGLIDFYFACTDALAYDLAICLNAWCFEPDGSFNRHQGPGDDRRLREGPAASRLRRSRRLPIARAAARRCASC